MNRQLLLHCLLLPTTLASALNIGIILRENQDKHIAVAFQTAVRWLNTHKSGNVTIERSSVQYLKTTKEAEIMSNLCQLAESGVSFVVGPPDRQIGAVIEALCEELHIIYIKYYWDVLNQMPRNKVGFSVSVFPTQLYLDMTKELLLYWRWEKVVFVYRQDISIVRFHALIANPLLFKKIQVVIVRVEDNSNEAFLNAAKRVRNFCDEGECWRTMNRVLLELNAADARRYLNAALQLGMINLRNWYFLTMLDLPKFDIEPFRHNLVRISATTIWWRQTADVVLDADVARQLFAETKQAWIENHANVVFTPMTDIILTFDAVMLAARVHAKVAESQGAGAFETWASCNLNGQRKMSRPLSKGVALREHIKHVSVKGLSGTIEFNDYNKRMTTVFRIIELGVDGKLANTGNWSSHPRSILDMHDKELENTHSKVMIDQLTRPKLRVTTIEERPYVMKRLHSSTFEGNARYEGFCVDLLTKLSENLGFDFEINVVDDGKYGEPINETSGKWDGMIGQLLNKHADMAVAPITVTARRLEVIDFTNPFLQLGISMLMRVPGPKHFDLMSFLYPLSTDVWIYLCLATVCTTLVMVIIARLSPYEWTCIPEQSTPENTLWYLICVLLRAGSGYNPRTASTRVLSGVWWAFTLILIAQYTANFAAVLTVDRKSMPFNSLDELSNQTEYAFGSIVGGSTAQFFKDSHLENFKDIWQKMESAAPSAFVPTNKDGVQRVLQDKYVFLMESASMEYEVTQNCNLTQVGDVVLGSKGYSIALPKGSPWREPLSRQILDFNEKGIIMLLKNIWWKQKKRPTDDENGDGDCIGKADAVNVYEFHSPLGFGQVAGLFLALTAGLGFAFCVAIGEYLFFAYKASKRSANLLSDNRKQIDLIHSPPQTMTPTTTITTVKPRGWSKLESEQVRRAVSFEQPVAGVLRASLRRREIKV
uniref:Glutamate receptor ionotropic, kainate 2 n=1 Tax=Plectus sambesii TaxID=2011161 RepID=A0A914VZL7_9BILA